MIRLWTGCVTDDEFYDYCDKYGIMVWRFLAVCRL